jgi:hypothetical protein
MCSAFWKHIHNPPGRLPRPHSFWCARDSLRDMSALGHKRTFALRQTMSALPPKADIGRREKCASFGQSLVPPKVFETRRRQFGIAHRVLDISVGFSSRWVGKWNLGQ